MLQCTLGATALWILCNVTQSLFPSTVDQVLFNMQLFASFFDIFRLTVHKVLALTAGNHWSRWNMTFNYATVKEAEIRKSNWGLKFFFIRVTWAWRINSSIHTSHTPHQPDPPPPSNLLLCLSAAHRVSISRLWTPGQMKMPIFSHPCLVVLGMP